MRKERRLSPRSARVWRRLASGFGRKDLRIRVELENRFMARRVPSGDERNPFSRGCGGFPGPPQKDEKKERGKIKKTERSGVFLIWGRGKGEGNIFQSKKDTNVEIKIDGGK